LFVMVDAEEMKNGVLDVFFFEPYKAFKDI